MYIKGANGRDARENPFVLGGHVGPDPIPSCTPSADKDVDFVPEDSETKEIRTTDDLDIAELKARLDAIETDYKKKLGEAEEANRGLWARLQQQTPTETAPEPVPEGAEFVTSFWTIMGPGKKE